MLWEGAWGLPSASFDNAVLCCLSLSFVSTLRSINVSVIIRGKATLTQKIVQEAPIEPEALNYQLIDVGGQRNERKKWIHHFADVKCVLFVVNLAGYKQILFEEDGGNAVAML